MKRRLKSALIASAALIALGPDAAAEAKTQRFDIAAQPARAALSSFAQQAGVQILFPSFAVAGLSTPAVRGDLTASEALDRLARPAGLVVAAQNDRTITLAQAQTSPRPQSADRVEEVIVTARRREETQQRVPVSITAFTGAALEQRGYQSLTDIQRAAPNLSFTPGTGGKTGSVSPFIRGVGEYDFIITSDPSVALYVDGVYVARSFGANTQLLGIDRVEVLRGPQGTLFGKNTIGGAVVVTTHKPDGSKRLDADIMGGSFGTIQGRLAAEAPITRSLFAGISLMAKKSDGWQKIQNDEALGDEGIFAGRGTLRWKGDEVDAVLAIDGLHQRQNSAAHNMLSFSPTVFSGLQSALIAPCCTVPADIDRTESTDFFNHDDADAVNVTLTVDFKALGGSIKSISAYRGVSALFGRDGDASAALNYAGDIHDERVSQFSQELLYNTDFIDDRAHFLFGLYAFREHSRDHTTLYVAKGLYDALVGIGTPPATAALLDFNLDFDNRQITTNFAVFQNLTIDLTEKLSFSIGARFTYEAKKFNQKTLRLDSQIPLLPDLEYALRANWSNFSPKGTITYQFTPDIMAYVTYSEGFRSGGFNGRPTSTLEIGPYNPEKLRSMEVGAKTELFDNRLRLNADVYYNKYNNMQVQITTAAGPIVVNRTENAAKARIWGVEAEATGIVTDWLALDASLGLTDAHYENYISGGVDLTGKRLRQTAKWSWSLGGTITLPVTETIEARLRGDASYKSSFYTDTLNTPILNAPERTLVNANLTFDFKGTGLALSVIGENLSDKRVLIEGFDTTPSFGFAEGYFTPPRRIFARLSYRWGER